MDELSTPVDKDATSDCVLLSLSLVFAGVAMVAAFSLSCMPNLASRLRGLASRFSKRSRAATGALLWLGRTGGRDRNYGNWA